MDDKKDDFGTYGKPAQKHGEGENDNETILMALDQISQTIDVMTSVVGRLRHFVEEQGQGREAELREAMRPDRILH